MCTKPSKSSQKISRKPNQTKHRKPFLPRALLLGAVSSALLIFGQELPLRSEKQALPHAKPSARILEKYDTNRNGVLDPEEREALRKDIIARLNSLRGNGLGRQGSNQGGAFLEQQAKETRAKVRAAQLELLMPKVLEKYDLNHNGVLDPDEIAKMRQDRQAWLQRINARILQKYDVNRNGVLDPEEREAIRADAAANRQATLAKYDTNHDGMLDAAERAAAIADLKQKRLPKQ
jgi:Ca2+-binding EF-hand superfamily protein